MQVGLGLTAPLISYEVNAFQQTESQTISLLAQKASLGEEPKTNDPRVLENFFLEKIEESIKEGDLNKREAILRRWLEKSPESRAAKDTLGFFLVRYSKDPSEGIKLLESALRKAENEKRYFPYTTTAAKLIEFYGSVGEFELAEEIIANTKKVIARFSELPNQSEFAYRKAYSEARFQGALANYLYYRGKVKEGAEAAKLSVEGFSQLASFAQPRDPRASSHAKLNHFRGLVRLASFFRVSGNHYAAEQALRSAFELATTIEQRGDVVLGVEIATLRFEQGLFKESEDTSRRLLNTWQDNKLADVSAQFIDANAVLNRALAAQQKWGELIEQFAFIDQLASSNLYLKSLAYQPEIRWLGHFFTGDTERALRITKDLLDVSKRVYEQNHPTFALHQGFYAVTLSKYRDPIKKAEAKALFVKSIANLASDEGLGESHRNEFHRFLLNLIFTSYAETLLSEKSPSVEDIESAFSTLALERGSSVQVAIQDAAIRAGLNDPELSEMVRMDQDSARELEALYRLLAKQGEEGSLLEAVATKIRARVHEINGFREDIRKKIKVRRPDFAALVAPEPVSLKDIRNGLGPNEVFMSIHPLRQGFLSFAFDKVSISHSQVQLSGEEVAHLVLNIRKTLDVADKGRRAPAFDLVSSRSLYEAFIKPHQKVISRNKSLVVSTVGALSQIPFSVLTTAQWAGKDYSEAPWLAKDVSISYSPSPSAWLSIKKLSATKAGNLPLLAWGDPSYKMKSSDKEKYDNLHQSKSTRTVTIDRPSLLRDLTQPIVDVVIYENLPPLPETRDEVLELAQVLGADRFNDLILGPQATRESVLSASQSGHLAKRSVVVFATHGLIAGDLPKLTQPALAMASSGNPEESPLLTLDDVLSLKLNADWVVLSACNTAAADGRAGEALSGLARGFFYAGSRSLLVTHWSVESRSATLLTTETFKAYKANPLLTRADALNKALLSVMKNPEYRHPAFWAPYVLVGEGGR